VCDALLIVSDSRGQSGQMCPFVKFKCKNKGCSAVVNVVYHQYGSCPPKGFGVEKYNANGWYVKAIDPHRCCSGDVKAVDKVVGQSVEDEIKAVSVSHWRALLSSGPRPSAVVSPGVPTAVVDVGSVVGTKPVTNAAVMPPGVGSAAASVESVVGTKPVTNRQSVLSFGPRRVAPAPFTYTNTNGDKIVLAHGCFVADIHDHVVLRTSIMGMIALTASSPVLFSEYSLHGVCFLL
jgi:hypothetical protein